MKDHNILLELISQFEKLPGLGEKSAERIAFHLIKTSNDELNSLSKSINSIKDIKYCPICFNITESSDKCYICGNNFRDKTIICVVEEITDLWALEQTGAYRGLYHILKGRISPLEGIGPETLTIKKLIERTKDSSMKEVILATSHTLEGDATAVYIQDKLSNLKVKVSRIACGIPAGSKIETASRPMLSEALKERKSFNFN
jgi:recombination protein RecR